MFPEIKDELFWRLYEVARPYSLVHVTGFYNTFQTMHYVARNHITGALVECGCFLGGMAIFTALLREHLGMHRKPILLFDTFNGFPEDSEDVYAGQPQKGARLENFLDGVRMNFEATLGHLKDIEFVVGPVEETIPGHSVGLISVLRLDTDYYPSTRVELEYLYPKLSEAVP